MADLDVFDSAFGLVCLLAAYLGRHLEIVVYLAQGIPQSRFLE
jgi:hypothetical protein